MHASKNNYLTAKFRGGASLGNDGGRISALNWGKAWRIVGKDHFPFFINRFEILGEGRWMWCLGFFALHFDFCFYLCVISTRGRLHFFGENLEGSVVLSWIKEATLLGVMGSCVSWTQQAIDVWLVGDTQSKLCLTICEGINKNPEPANGRETRWEVRSRLTFVFRLKYIVYGIFK